MLLQFCNHCRYTIVKNQNISFKPKLNLHYIEMHTYINILLFHFIVILVYILLMFRVLCFNPKQNLQSDFNISPGIFPAFFISNKIGARKTFTRGISLNHKFIHFAYQHAIKCICSP